MAENKKDKSAEFARDKSAFLKVAPKRELLRKKYSVGIPVHISQEMQMTLLEMF